MNEAAIRVLGSAILLWEVSAAPAVACLSCGCGGSGTTGDMGAMGGTASLFSMGHAWLIQQGLSVRAITGSFNERGEWHPVPVDGSLHTFQGTLGVSYFPAPGMSVGLQLPMLVNRLDKAAWGPMGSVSPTDLGPSVGAALGDVGVQVTAKALEGPWWALAGWAGTTLATGRAAGEPAGLSGTGVANGQLGLLAVAQVGDWEWTANVGLQRPFGTPAIGSSTFYVGDAWMYQAQGSYRLGDAWRFGLAVNGSTGRGRFGASELPVPTAGIKLVPTLQYAWDASQGIKLAAGHDPGTWGMNGMSDSTATLVMYRFLP